MIQPRQTSLDVTLTISLPIALAWLSSSSSLLTLTSHDTTTFVNTLILLSSSSPTIILCISDCSSSQSRHDRIDTSVNQAQLYGTNCTFSYSSTACLINYSILLSWKLCERGKDSSELSAGMGFGEWPPPQEMIVLGFKGKERESLLYDIVHWFL